MTFWAAKDGNGSVKNANITGAGLVTLEVLAASCDVGPNADTVIRAMGMSKLLGRTPTFSNEPRTTPGIDCFGLDPVLVCADINSPHYGIWGLNAVGEKEIKEQQAHPELGGAPWGYYQMIYSDMPAAEQYIKAGQWSDAARAHLEQYQPALWDRIRTLQGFPPKGGAGSVSAYPPGPDDAKSATDAAQDKNAVEFTLIEGVGYWIARTPSESASTRKDNPHKGVSVINPDQWAKSVPGGHDATRYLDILGLQDYADAGWTGLARPILSYDGRRASPATEDLQYAMDRAMMGDEGALKALSSIGVKPPADAWGIKAHRAVSIIDDFI